MENKNKKATKMKEGKDKMKAKNDEEGENFEIKRQIYIAWDMFSIQHNVK